MKEKLRFKDVIQYFLNISLFVIIESDIQEMLCVLSVQEMQII